MFIVLEANRRGGGGDSGPFERRVCVFVCARALVYTLRFN